MAGAAGSCRLRTIKADARRQTGPYVLILISSQRHFLPFFSAKDHP
jgi:hypothetical protein